MELSANTQRLTANTLLYPPKKGVEFQQLWWVIADLKRAATIDEVNQIISLIPTSTATGDVVGPASAVDNDVAVYDGTTGKLIKDGGLTIAQIIAAGGAAGTQDLSEVLAEGNVTGGTDIVVSAGDELQITDATASRIARIGTSKEVTFFDTTTYPNETELSYLKGVTSPIQTQFSGKQDTLVSGTNIKTVNGTTLLGSGDLGAGYTLNVFCQLSSQPQNTNRYFGNVIRALIGTSGVNKIYFPKTGTIKWANIYSFVTGVTGTNESWSCYIRINNTTDHLVATVSSATDERIWANSGLSISVNQNDYFEIKLVAPVTWATAPTNVVFGGNIYVE